MKRLVVLATALLLAPAAMADVPPILPQPEEPDMPVPAEPVEPDMPGGLIAALAVALAFGAVRGAMHLRAEKAPVRR